MTRRQGIFLGCICLMAAICIAAGSGALVRINRIATTVSSPQVVSVSTTPVTLFSSNLNDRVNVVLLRTVQNAGSVPVLYRINDANVLSTAYHGVLAPGESLRDGLGSVLDLSSVPFPVSFATEAGTTELSVVELTQ